jgi:hypothetical protein
MAVAVKDQQWLGRRSGDTETPVHIPLIPQNPGQGTSNNHAKLAPGASRCCRRFSGRRPLGSAVPRSAPYTHLWYSNGTTGTRRLFGTADFPVCWLAGFQTCRRYRKRAHSILGRPAGLEIGDTAGWKPAVRLAQDACKVQPAVAGSSSPKAPARLTSPTTSGCTGWRRAGGWGVYLMAGGGFTP